MGRRRIRTDAERAALEAEQAQRIRDALDGPGADNPTAPLRDPVTPGGDARRLRGIPAIGPGVSGAIPGTDPEREVTR